MSLSEAIQQKIVEIQHLSLDVRNLNVGFIMDEAQRFSDVLRKGQRVALMGNGGSAAEAMHIAAEFTGRCVEEHEPWNVICLNESQSAITAIANDYGTEYIFERLVQAHLKSGDLLIGLSTSGKSPNVLRALDKANSIGVETVLWMGDFEAPRVDVKCLKVNSKSTPRIQEVHLMWGHLIAETVERIMLELP